MSSAIAGHGTARAPLRERKDDLYQTPPEAVRALLRAEPLPKRIWEPACGPGAIARELRAAGHQVWATDLVDYESRDQDSARRDFLMQPRMGLGQPILSPTFGQPIEAIVTNPPFKLAHEFVAKARELCPLVIMLLRLAFLESEKRRDILDQGDLARVHVFRKRLPMMHRDGWDGPKSTSQTAFAWFVWDRNNDGPTELRRLDWEPAP